MPARQVLRSAWVLVFCLAPCASAPGQHAPRKVPPDLAGLLAAAQSDLQANRPANALRRLAGYTGEDHALRHLLLGHAYSRQNAAEAAGNAYQTALRMDATLWEAGLGLAQVRARQGQWAEAARLLGQFVRTDTCDADTLLLYAQVARRMNDARLAELLLTRGICRFPADLRFRRLDLAACLDGGDPRRAARAVDTLLKASPTDPDLWQQRAFACDQADRQADTIAALEAALLCDPNDLDRHRRFVGAILATGDWCTVVRQGRSLLAGPLAKAAVQDIPMMELLISAADMGRQEQTLAAWLARVPEASRTRGMRIVAARRALRLGEVAEARAALRRLTEQGEADANVLLWAGHLAERAKDWPEAESLYAHARKLKGAAARLATLYLARLYFQRERAKQAARLLHAYLDAHPEDAPARALLAVVEAGGV